MSSPHPSEGFLGKQEVGSSDESPSEATNLQIKMSDAAEVCVGRRVIFWDRGPLPDTLLHGATFSAGHKLITGGT